MIMPPGAFFILAIIIWVARSLSPEEKKEGGDYIMIELNPFVIFFAAIFTNNMILSNFLGMCSFIAVSKEIPTSLGLGQAVTFVLTFTTILNYLIYHHI